MYKECENGRRTDMQAIKNLKKLKAKNHFYCRDADDRYMSGDVFTNRGFNISPHYVSVLRLSTDGFRRLHCQ